MNDLVKLNADLARVLGVTDTSRVRLITLTLSPHDVPTVRVERIVLPKDGAALTDQLQTLVEVHALEPVPRRLADATTIADEARRLVRAHSK